MKPVRSVAAFLAATAAAVSGAFLSLAEILEAGPPCGTRFVSAFLAGRSGGDLLFGPGEPGAAAGGLSDDPLVPLWSYATGAVTMSSPRIKDVDGDGIKEVVLATMGVGSPYAGGNIFVFDRTGQVLPGWPVTVSSPFTSCAVAVADLDNDLNMELVAESWNYVYVWNHDGTNYPGWPKSHGTGYSVSAAVADLDGDGDLEIICPTGTKLNAWHHNGTALPGWPFTAPKALSAPAVADIDGDGALEIAAGCWEGPYPGSGPYPFYVWEADGTLAPGFPLAPPGQTRGPVSLGDLELDGDMDIVARINDAIYVWDAQGNVKAGWPVSAGYIRNSATALGDLDGDGDLEIVIGGLITVPSYKEQVFAFHHTGAPVAGWPVTLSHPGAVGNINSGPIIADIDGDPNQIEVVVKVTDYIFALHSDGSVAADFPYLLSDENQSGTFSPSPAVGDLDGNGNVEFVFVSVSGRIELFDQAHAYGEKYAYWPVFQQNPLNTCYYAGYGNGDLNCDGVLNAFDIDPFVLALTAPAAYAAFYPDCNVLNADCNRDGVVNAFDIDPFVALLTTP